MIDVNEFAGTVLFFLLENPPLEDAHHLLLVLYEFKAQMGAQTAQKNTRRAEEATMKLRASTSEKVLAQWRTKCSNQPGAAKEWACQLLADVSWLAATPLDNWDPLLAPTVDWNGQLETFCLVLEAWAACTCPMVTSTVGSASEPRNVLHYRARRMEAVIRALRYLLWVGEQPATPPQNGFGEAMTPGGFGQASALRATYFAVVVLASGCKDFHKLIPDVVESGILEHLPHFLFRVTVAFSPLPIWTASRSEKPMVVLPGCLAYLCKQTETYLKKGHRLPGWNAQRLRVVHKCRGAMELLMGWWRREQQGENPGGSPNPPWEKVKGVFQNCGEAWSALACFVLCVCQTIIPEDRRIWAEAGEINALRRMVENYNSLYDLHVAAPHKWGLYRSFGTGARAFIVAAVVSKSSKQLDGLPWLKDLLVPMVPELSTEEVQAALGPAVYSTTFMLCGSQGRAVNGLPDEATPLAPEALPGLLLLLSICVMQQTPEPRDKYVFDSACHRMLEFVGATLLGSSASKRHLSVNAPAAEIFMVRDGFQLVLRIALEEWRTRFLRNSRFYAVEFLYAYAAGLGESLEPQVARICHAAIIAFEEGDDCPEVVKAAVPGVESIDQPVDSLHPTPNSEFFILRWIRSLKLLVERQLKACAVAEQIAASTREAQSKTLAEREAAAEAAAAELLQEEEQAITAKASKAAKKARQKERRAAQQQKPSGCAALLICALNQVPLRSPVIAADGLTYDETSFRLQGQASALPLLPNRAVKNLLAQCSQW